MNEKEAIKSLSTYIEDMGVAIAWLSCALDSLNAGNISEARELIKQGKERSSPWLIDSVYKHLNTIL
jgi:hypothetical protein